MSVQTLQNLLCWPRGIVELDILELKFAIYFKLKEIKY